MTKPAVVTEKRSCKPASVKMAEAKYPSTVVGTPSLLGNCKGGAVRKAFASVSMKHGAFDFPEASVLKLLLPAPIKTRAILPLPFASEVK